MLLEHGAGLDIPAGEGQPVLISAVRAKLMNLVDLLLTKGANINAQDNRGRTAIMHACRDPTYAEADLALILAFKPDLNLTDNEGLTAVMGCLDKAKNKRSIAHKMHSRAQLLLEHGADVNAKSHNSDNHLMRLGHNGDTALTILLTSDSYQEYKFESHQSDWLELLLRHGADMNIPGKGGDTPLLLALKHAHRLVPRLLECGVNVNAMGSYNSPLVYALQGPSRFVPTLLEHGADVNAPEPYGPSPILSAIKYAKTMLPLLLERGADVNVRGCRGRTALMDACLEEACQEDDEETETNYTEQILDLGADVDAVDEEGNSALMQLCNSYRYSESTYLIDLLLSRGADLSIKNKAGKTASDLAYKNKNVYDLLIEYAHKTDFILK